MKDVPLPITTSYVAHKVRYNELRYLPTFVGALSPLSIMLSIPPLVGPWKTSEGLQDYQNTKPLVFTISLLLAVFFCMIANMCLLYRFQEKRIVLCTWLAIGFYLSHAILTLGPMLYFFKNNPLKDEEKFTGDFLIGFMVIFLSMILAILLIIDYFKHGQLRQRGSGISYQQRNLVLFCILVTFWSALGAFIFSFVEGWTFTQGVYFTLVTMTTIGYGDQFPKLLFTRIFLFLYAIVGIIMMGILINSITNVILESFESAFLAKLDQLKSGRLERLVMRNKSGMDGGNYVPKSNLEKLIQEREFLLYQQLIFSIVTLLLFWFGGAELFFLTEPDWSYFDSLYFCFVSFTTIGYGDVILTSSRGRILFIVYSLCGLVAAAYVISVATTLWSLILARRQVKITNKHRFKTLPESPATQTNLDMNLHQLDQATFHHLLEKVRSYHDQVENYLTQCDLIQLTSNPNLNQLAEDHQTFTNLLQKYPSTPSIPSKY